MHEIGLIAKLGKPSIVPFGKWLIFNDLYQDYLFEK